jgi:hypothetical protein
VCRTSTMRNGHRPVHRWRAAGGDRRNRLLEQAVSLSAPGCSTSALGPDVDRATGGRQPRRRVAGRPDHSGCGSRRWSDSTASRMRECLLCIATEEWEDRFMCSRMRAARDVSRSRRPVWRRRPQRIGLNADLSVWVGCGSGLGRNQRNEGVRAPHSVSAVAGFAGQR